MVLFAGIKIIMLYQFLLDEDEIFNNKSETPSFVDDDLEMTDSLDDLFENILDSETFNVDDNGLELILGQCYFASHFYILKETRIWFQKEKLNTDDFQFKIGFHGDENEESLKISIQVLGKKILNLIRLGFCAEPIIQEIDSITEEVLINFISIMPGGIVFRRVVKTISEKISNQGIENFCGI